MSNELADKAIRGIELYYEQKYDEAEVLLREAANAGIVNGIYGMALIDLHRGNEYNGIRKLKSIISRTTSATATLAKVVLAEVYLSKGDFENIYQAVYYYEYALDDDDNDVKKGVSENLKEIRRQMNALMHESNSYYEKLAIKGIDMLNHDNSYDAEKALKTSFIMGVEASIMGLALYYYRKNQSEDAIVLLERYMKRSKERTFMEETYILAADIYEEEADKIVKKFPSKAENLYMKAINAIRTSLNYIRDIEIATKLKLRLSKVTGKYNNLIRANGEEPEYASGGQGIMDKVMEIALSPEMEQYCNEQRKKEEVERQQREESEKIAQEIFSQMTVTPVESEPNLPKTIAEYVTSFESKIQKYSIFFPYGEEFKNNKKYASKMNKKIKNAVSVLKNQISASDVLFFSDISIWGSGKKFFILTENCIYYRYFSEIEVIKYSDIEEGVKIKSIGKVTKEGSESVYIDSCYACSFYTRKEAEIFKEMLEGCLKIYKMR